MLLLFFVEKRIFFKINREKKQKNSFEKTRGKKEKKTTEEQEK